MMDSPSAQLVTDEDVYLGFWINWSRGRTCGATLTLNRRNGGLLTAFLALFVTVVGTRFWRLGCFCIHRYFSSEHARDALCHQQQAILRNAAESTSGLWTLLRACWAWRRNGLSPSRRFLSSILFAILTFMVFSVATIFSSEIATSMGQEVLLRGSNCGYLSQNITGLDDGIALQSYLSQRTALSMAYAQRCYNNNANSRDCSILYKPRLQWTIDQNATCPFSGAEKICLSSSGNLHLDTGFIDSDRDLGINSPSGMRFLYRSAIDCAPLKTKEYTRKTSYAPIFETSAKGDTGRKVMQYFYGKSLDWTNFTYQYATDGVIGPSVHDGIEASASSDFTLEAFGAYSDVDGTILKAKSRFIPIPALQANATDVTLFFLSTNGIVFTKPCDDPWYAAHYSKVEDDTWADPSSPAHVQDGPARVLGCAERYQFCNPDFKMGPSCTPFTGIFTATAAAETLWQTNKQKQFFNISFNSILKDAGDLYDIVMYMGISSLIARRGLTGGFQGSLPNNQWQLEVENWFTSTLADLQRVTVEYATGPTDPAVFQLLERAQTDEEQLMCRNLKIRSDAVTSFSVLGLGILFGLGVLIIVFSLIIAPLAHRIDIWLGRNNYKRLEWAINDFVQLQRLAHEELGCGTWIGGDEFPITALGQKLAVLDVADPCHPKLVNPTAARTLVDDVKNDANDVDGADDTNCAHDANNTNEEISPQRSNDTAVDVPMS